MRRMRCMPWQMIVSPLVVLLLAVTHRDAQAAKKDKDAESVGAAIVFPVKDKLDPDQGSIEAICCLSYSFGDDMIPPNHSAAWLFPIVSIHDKTGVRYEPRDADGLAFHFGFSQYQGSDRFSFWSNRFEKPQEFGQSIFYILIHVPPGQEPQLKAGDWHAVATTWQRKGSEYDLALYLDGKCVRSYSLPVNPKTADKKFESRDLLFIGNPHKALGSLQSLRISKRVRTGAEIADAVKAGLVKDADTLLYLDADIIAAMRTDKREDLVVGKAGPKSISVPPEGKVYGKIEIIAGRDGGKAVRFQVP